jgi:hypothetical protein
VKVAKGELWPKRGRELRCGSHMRRRHGGYPRLGQTRVMLVAVRCGTCGHKGFVTKSKLRRILACSQCESAAWVERGQPLPTGASLAELAERSETKPDAGRA